MTTLHLIFSAEGLQSCLGIIQPEDALLLIEDGVYAVLGDSATRLHAIEDDLVARGLQDLHADNVQRIDYSGMVELVARHQPIVSWH